MNFLKLYWREIGIAALIAACLYQLFNPIVDTVVENYYHETTKAVTVEKIVEVEKVKTVYKTRNVNREITKFDPNTGKVVENVKETTTATKDSRTNINTRVQTKETEQATSRTGMERLVANRPNRLLVVSYGPMYRTLDISLGVRVLPALPGYITVGTEIRLNEQFSLPPPVKIGLALEF